MIVELRQYTLRPGGRDVLIELFDREFLESQEAEGMAILGQFRDLDRPDRFVWLRGFADMATRAEALTRFYGGPVWRAHSARANATMLDCDDVLLLHPLDDGLLDLPQRPPLGEAALPGSAYLVIVRPNGTREVHCGHQPLARLATEHSANNFPALPLREGVDMRVSLTRLESAAELDQALVGADLGEAEQVLRLAPTARSALR